MSIAAIVLAAGGGTRFDGPVHKLLAEFRGRPLVTWAIESAMGASLDEVAVITGSVPLDSVVPAGVSVIENPDWASGQASSLQTAVCWSSERGHDAIVVD